MSSSRPVFRSRWLPYLLVAPQLVITVIFFIWPAGEALWYSVQSVDPFGLSSQFVGLDNFAALWHDSYYIDAFWTTIKFNALVTVSGLVASLFFAALVDYVVRGSRLYQSGRKEWIIPPCGQCLCQLRQYLFKRYARRRMPANQALSLRIGLANPATMIDYQHTIRNILQDALIELAALREPVDEFFENVMVNAEDKDVRINRLTLLSKLRELFLQVADISLLQ